MQILHACVIIIENAHNYSSENNQFIRIHNLFIRENYYDFIVKSSFTKAEKIFIVMLIIFIFISTLILIKKNKREKIRFIERSIANRETIIRRIKKFIYTNIFYMLSLSLS